MICLDLFDIVEFFQFICLKIELNNIKKFAP